MAESPRGVVVWFVGRPGAGKSYAARRVHEQLLRLRAPCVLLDGDVVRGCVVPPHGYSDEGRRDHYATLANLAASLASQGLIVLCPATAPRREFRDHARSVAPAFLEVHVDVSLDAAMRQDVGRAARVYGGVVTGAVPGVDAPFEAPTSPDVLIDLSNRHRAVELVLVRLWSAIGQGGLGGQGGLLVRAPMSYVGVTLDGAHVTEQREICQRGGVEPRPELHLTLAFLGDADVHQLAALQRELVEARLPWEALRLESGGVGGADIDDRRVLWWSVAPSPELLELRDAVVAAARRVVDGVTTLGDAFSPHVTLGSRAPEPLWDIHDVHKIADREPWSPPRPLTPLVAHITNIATHPASLLPIYSWA